MATVTNTNGKALDFDAAVNLMDDEIREKLHNQQDWQKEANPEQAFFSAYEKAHEAKYGEQWELSKANPVW